VGVAVGGSSSLNNNYPLPTPPPQGGEGADRASGKDVGQPATNDGATHHLTWLALEPLTGRTHQLRVHCAAMGWPILGDSVYGSAPRTGGPGLHLHAREIVVPLYKNRAPIQVTAPVPPHMHERLRACGWSGDTLKHDE
jgi:tRNA pseudouridine32 synthase/23S rRNA pseudouridine746 synthase